MGLDMYLLKKHHFYNDENLKIQGGIKKIDTEKVKNITEEVGYWRKANQIHKWFVDNVQDGKDNCAEYWVSQQQLKELLDICKKILSSSKLIKGKIRNGKKFEGGEWVDIMEDGEYIENPKIAQKLLPTSEGSFFGSYDYDKYYLDDIKNTIEILERILKDEDGDYYYTSSW